MTKNDVRTRVDDPPRELLGLRMQLPGVLDPPVEGQDHVVHLAPHPRDVLGDQDGIQWNHPGPSGSAEAEAPCPQRRYHLLC